MHAHRALGEVLMNTGDLTGASEQFRQALALYDADRHGSLSLLYGQDVGTFCHAFAAITSWAVVCGARMMTFTPSPLHFCKHSSSSMS